MKYENLAETNSRLIAAMLFFVAAVIAPMAYILKGVSGELDKHKKLPHTPLTSIDLFNDYIKRIENKDITLKTIKLKNAKLGDDRIEQLMQALDANPEVAGNITKLNLYGNEITTIKFPNLPKLREIRLNGNPLRPFAIATIKNFKKETIANKHTIRIFFDGSCDDRAVKAAEEVTLDIRQRCFEKNCKTALLNFSKNKKMSPYMPTNGLDVVSINPDNPRVYRVRKPAAQTCS